MSDKLIMDDIEIVLRGSPRRTLPKIYSDYFKLKGGRVVPSYKAVIRNQLQRGCPERPEWNGKDRRFEQVANGVWALRKKGT